MDFERRRHIPVRYDRQLMATTLKAMKRVQEIKARRERVQAKIRLLGKKELEKQSNLNAVRQNLELIDTPSLKESVKQIIETKEMQLN